MKTKQKILNEKKPFIDGFFSFIISLFLLFLSLQWFSKLATIVFSNTINISLQDGFDIFINGLRQDISITGYIAFSILIFFLIYFHCRKSFLLIFIRSLVFLFVFAHITVVVADIQLLNYWSHKLDLQALFYLKYPQEVSHNLSNIHWLMLFFLIIGLTIGVYLLIWRILQKKIIQVSAISAKNVLIIIPLLFLCIRGGVGLMPVLISDASYSNNQQKNALATNSMWNFFYLMTEAGGIQEVDHLLNTNFPVNSICKEYMVDQQNEFTPFYWDKCPNVVVIVLEGFTAEMSAFFEGHDGNEMPYIDSLASEGYAFTKAYASGDRTDKGLLSIFSGWPGQTWQNIINHPSKLDKLPALARQFKIKRGYQTRFYYGGDLDFANMEFYLKINGFQSIIGKDHIQTNLSKIGKWGIPDNELFEFVARDINQLPTPYFASVLTLSTHEPFDIAPENLQSVKEKMAFCMRYTDRSLREFMRKMSKSKDFENTLFVITADHGKELNTIHTSRNNRNFFHVPLFFYGKCLPKFMKKQVYRDVVSQTDIYQSLHHFILQSIDKKAKYSRSFFAEKVKHPKNALCNLTGSTIFIDSLSYSFLPTDKMSIQHKKYWNSTDSLLFGIQSKIIQDFFR